MPILDYQGRCAECGRPRFIREALMLSEFYNVAEGIGSTSAPVGARQTTCKDQSSGAIRRRGQPCWVCGRERVASIDLFLVRTVTFQLSSSHCLFSATKRRCGLRCPQTRRPSGWRARSLKPASKRLVGANLPVARAQNNFDILRKNFKMRQGAMRLKRRLSRYLIIR